MLKEFVEKKHCIFAEKADSWQDALRLCCKPLEADGTVSEAYSQQIIACVEKYGPYIVLMPGVAMPHSQENAEGVYKTAISFMKLEQPVAFDENDRDKDAKLFFTLASCNHDEHLQNMSRLSEMLMNEDLVNDLMEAKNEEDLLELENKYMSGGSK